MKFAEAAITLFRAPKSPRHVRTRLSAGCPGDRRNARAPLAGSIGGTIIALFCLAMAWAWFGHIDIVASASGKIIPSGRTKVIQPFETGVVRAIQVRDGQSVKAGDVLIELDPTMNEAERQSPAK